MGRAARSVGVVLVALVLAALVAFFAAGGYSPGKAEAQTTTTPPSDLTEDESRILPALLKDTNSPDPERAARAQRVLTKAAPKAVPRLTPVLMRLGLVGAAGASVTWAAVEFKVLLEQGEPGESVHAGLPARLAPGAITGYGSEGEGGPEQVYLVTEARWEVWPQSAGHKYRWALEWQRAVENWYVYNHYTCGQGGQRWTAWASHVFGPTKVHYAGTIFGCGGPSAYQTDFSMGEEGWSEWAGNPQLSNPRFATEIYERHFENQAAQRVEKKPFGPDPLPLTGRWSINISTPTYEVSEGIRIPATPPADPDFVTTPIETYDLVEAIKRDPEFDLDEDGLINADDPDDDGDGVPDQEDPAPYDPYSPKPWLDPDFRAPVASAEREALWGPVIGVWTTLGGGECREYQYGAKICDFPGGSTFVWIVQDWTAWMQGSDGGKDSFYRPQDRPQTPPTVSPGNDHETDPMEEPEAALIANHAINNSGHHVPGIEPWDDEQKLADYVFNVVNGVELSRQFGQMPSGLEGPFYPTTGDSKAYWDDNRKVIIVRNPNDTSGGTVFKPDRAPGEERGYLTDNFPHAKPPGSR